MRCLIADDEYISRRVVSELMRPWAEIEAVASGEEALLASCLAMDSSSPFDLVLLDIEMPGMDGHEALRCLRREEQRRGLSGTKAAAVIMTTVRDDPASVFAAFRDQCEAYLIKPVKRENLERELRQLRLIS